MPYGNRLIDHNHVSRVPLLRLDSTGDISSDTVSNVNMIDHQAKNSDRWFGSGKVDFGNMLNRKLTQFGGQHLTSDYNSKCKVIDNIQNRKLMEDSHSNECIPNLGKEYIVHQNGCSVLKKNMLTFHPAVMASSLVYSVPSTPVKHQSYIPKMTYCNFNRCYQNKFKQKFLNGLSGTCQSAGAKDQKSQSKFRKCDETVPEIKSNVTLKKSFSSPKNEAVQLEFIGKKCDAGEGNELCSANDRFEKLTDNEVVNDWLDLCTDDESEDSHSYVPETWDEEAEKLDQVDNCDDTSVNLNNKNLSTTNSRCSDESANVQADESDSSRSCKEDCSEPIKIQISPLKSSNEESESGLQEKEKYSADKSFILYVRKNNKKCKPSAKKRQRSKAKKTDDEAAENSQKDVKSKKSPQKCQNSTIAFMFGFSPNSNEAEPNDNATHSFYVQTFDDESDWSENDDSDHCDDENWTNDFLESEFESPLSLNVICSVNPAENDSMSRSKELKELNMAWQIQVSRRPSSSSLSEMKSKKGKKVHFPENGKLAEVFSIDTYVQEYQDARKGPWEQYALDHERFQRRIEETGKILTPVLLPEHRNLIYKSLTEKLTE